MPQHTDSGQYSKFLNQDAPSEFVEISLDSENEDQGRGPFAKLYHDQTSLIEIEPVFPSHLTQPIEAFFESAHTPSSTRSTSPVHAPPISSTFQDLDNDEVDEDLRFNEELANEMRHQCTLLSPSLVRAITSDIEEIKRSLSTTGVPKKTALPDLLPQHGDKEPRGGVIGYKGDPRGHEETERELLCGGGSGLKRGSKKHEPSRYRAFA